MQVPVADHWCAPSLPLNRPPVGMFATFCTATVPPALPLAWCLPCARLPVTQPLPLPAQQLPGQPGRPPCTPGRRRAMREAVMPLPLQDVVYVEQPERPMDAAVRCTRGHVMKARVSRELWARWYEAECDECQKPISSKDASYHCKECSHSICMNCAAEQHEARYSLPLDAGSQTPEFSVPEHCGIERGLRNQIIAGDILFCGPDRWGIHHVVLCRGPMIPAEPDVTEHIFKHHPDFVDEDVLCCDTIESTRPFRGQDFHWYPACSVYVRRRSNGELLLVGDIAEGTSTLGVNEVPVPVKVLLHPLESGHAGLHFDSEAFEEAVAVCAFSSKKWSRGTALRAITAKRSGLDAEEYADAESRSELMEELRRRWDKKPICSSVAIKVWQKYFEMSCNRCPDGTDLAVQCILRWMPVFSDQTAPSTLLKILSTCGWVLRGSLRTDPAAAAVH
mmetsp:Transcript_49254/g.136890  ORF Transcript_49254/g.136890 Transcript_49254/m.136890 type:complete len:449 (-) Transcript_49254:77-1423(-)